MALDAALAELDGILREVQASPRLNGAERVRLVIEVRSRIVAQIAALYNGLGADPRLQGSPALAREFADRLGALRLRMAELQARWRMSDLTEKFELYAVESRPVVEAIAEFVAWARQARRAA